MTDLRLRREPVADETGLERWRHVVGCSTERPPAGDEAVATVIARVATVIARVLPEYRGRGYGTALYEAALAHARVLGARAVETCVLAVNEDGLRFARARGFVEVERYVLDGEVAEWVDLRLMPRCGRCGAATIPLQSCGNHMWAASRSS